MFPHIHNRIRATRKHRIHRSQPNPQRDRIRTGDRSGRRKPLHPATSTPRNPMAHIQPTASQTLTLVGIRTQLPGQTRTVRSGPTHTHIRREEHP